MAAHELSLSDTGLLLSDSQYFDTNRPNDPDGRSEHTLVLKADSDTTHIYIAKSLYNNPDSNSMGLMVVNSPNKFEHYITRLSLPEPTEHDPNATVRVNAMLTFTAFEAIAKNEKARVFAKVEESDPEAIRELYDDKSDPRVWEHITTANDGRARIMGAYAHSLVGYSGIVLRDNVVKLGHKPQNNSNAGLA